MAWAKTGAFLPKSCVFTQDTAEAGVFYAQGFAMPIIRGTIEIVVVALPQWARTYRLFRYPSLIGRLRAAWYEPPFFVTDAKIRISERAIARAGGKSGYAFDDDVRLMLNDVTGFHSQRRGDVSCISDISGHRPLLPSRRLRPAGIQSLNKLRSGPLQVSEPRLSCRAALSQVRLSGLREMSFIVRHTRTVADHIAHSLRIAGCIHTDQGHLRVSRGWSFYIRQLQRAVAPLHS